MPYPKAKQQLYRLRTPSSGREKFVQADPDEIYIDRYTGEEMEVVGKVVPVSPSPSRLPWTVENLRFCTKCPTPQPVQKDLNDCPYCGKRLDPIE